MAGPYPGSLLLAFAFFDVKAYRKSWFMPLAAAGMDGITGFVYLSDRGWSPEGLIFFGTELLLCGASAYFYRIAFTPWTEKREEEGLTPRQTVSLLILAGTLLLTLSKITLLGDLSVGRCAAAAAVMATAYKGGIGVGATVGVACGLGMDLAAGGMPFYSMAFALSGVMCGVFHRQGRLAAALAYVLSNALAVLCTWSRAFTLSLLYEVFIASVVFLALPERALRQVGALVAREPRHDTQERARAYVRARMEATAAAFKSLWPSPCGRPSTLPHLMTTTPHPSSIGRPGGSASAAPCKPPAGSGTTSPPSTPSTTPSPPCWSGAGGRAETSPPTSPTAA